MAGPEKLRGGTTILVVGILFHLIYLRSIFDIYFKSPVVSVEQQFRSTNAPPAKRLFLIVGDGLRADKLFQNAALAPTLHGIATQQGSYGISHTRVPTESRPGHVALIAGLYEDVSAVTTGWQLNPVHFDSVFNQSRRTYSWGSPDILPMFKEGATAKEKISCYMYDAHAEDFTEDSTKLDTWVFSRVQDMFERAQTDSALATALRQDRTIFFLHLLGLDTAGHAHRPYSREYLENIAVVDQGVSDLLLQLQAFFTPAELDESAFLFTADHGMSDWGSHGDGHPDNTQTPYIAWGAGIRAARQAPDYQRDAAFSMDLALQKIHRADVAQADLAVLMAYLIGTNIPKNNAGTLPLDILEASESEQAQALLQNARQIHAQYESQRLRKLRQLHFSNLVEYAFSCEFERLISQEINSEAWVKAIDLTQRWIAESLGAMKYLQRYDWLFLRTVVTFGYLGWMLYTAVHVLRTYAFKHSAEESPIAPRETDSKAKFIFATLAITLIAYLAERSAPISYYAYVALPLYFWYHVAVNVRVLKRALTELRRPQSLGLALLALLTPQALAFAYVDRRTMTILMLFMASMPHFFASKIKSSRWLIWLWTASCTTCSCFTLLPTVQTENIVAVIAGGLLMTCAGLVYAVRYGGGFIIGAQTGVLILTTVITWQSSACLTAKMGLPQALRLGGWACMLLSWFLPFFGSPVDQVERIVRVFLAFAPSFVILSVSYEGLFYLNFWVILLAWTQFEVSVSQRANISKPQSMSAREVRLALVFLVLLQEAFFGTGNIASVSSFTLESVYRLVPVFDPFTMGILLLYKLLIPFVVLSVNLAVLNGRLMLGESAVAMVVLSICDGLTLTFFWTVRDEGSWLEIGSTISRFVIAGLLSLFVVSLERIGTAIV
ncbi:Glycosyl phosphatidyl inositol anchor synthesis [Savitreella phatthalungensis]